MGTKFHGRGGRGALAAFAAVVGAIALLTSACWTTYGGDAANTRVAHFAAGIGPSNVGSLHEVWRVSGTNGSTSTPAVVGDTVYFASWDGTLRAVAAQDGASRWARQLSNTIIDDSPLVYGDLLYVGDANGNLYAVNRNTGVPVWTRELDPHPNARIFSSPVAVDGLLIVGVASVELAIPKSDYTFRGSIVGLDARTGTERWRVYTTTNDDKAGAGVSVWSSAAIDTDRHLAYIGTGNTYEAPAAPLSDGLMAIDYRNGSVKWFRQFTAGDVYTIFGSPPQGPDADIGAAPNLFHIGGRAVVGVGDKAGVYAVLDRDTGATVWAKQLPTGSHLGGIMTTAAYNAGTLYLASNRWVNMLDFHDARNLGTTFALDAATGNVKWQHDLPAPAFGALTYANGVVFQPTVAGTLYAFDAATGAQLWSTQPGADLGSGVSVAGNTVFVPYGFWFFASPANPVGGLVAYRP
jgi:polyvinyl alcohol dehydrogenase (cytochrome)